MISDLVLVPASGAPLAGDLVVPGPVRSVVVITEGSSSSRGSSRDRALADTFHRAGMGTLLLDLLTELEKRQDARSARHLFDIPFLAQRLVDAIDWLDQRPETAGVPVCLFGGDSSALLAAAERPNALLPWSSEADVRTSRTTRCRASAPRCCSWSAATKRQTHASTRRLPESSARRPRSTSCAAQRICSMSQGRWRKSLPRPGSGSHPMWRADLARGQAGDGWGGTFRTPPQPAPARDQAVVRNGPVTS